MKLIFQDRSKEYEFQHGLARGLHGLWELTPTQVEIKAREGQVVNRGRIVYLTHVTDKEKLKVPQSSFYLNLNNQYYLVKYMLKQTFLN